MNRNKLIGILEMGQSSTQFYIQMLTDLYDKEHSKDLQSFKLVTTDFEAVNSLLPNRSDKLDAIIAKYLHDLALNDIACILIPNITIHETVDAVWDIIDSSLPIVHPLEGVINRMHKANKNKALIFGSKYTMTSDYIPTVLANADIAVAKVKLEDLEFIDQVRRQVYSEKATEETIVKFNNLVHTYSYEFTVLVACTELSRVLKIRNEHILDMAVIQVEDAVSIIKN